MPSTSLKLYCSVRRLTPSAMHRSATVMVSAMRASMNSFAESTMCRRRGCASSGDAGVVVDDGDHRAQHRLLEQRAAPDGTAAPWGWRRAPAAPTACARRNSSRRAGPGLEHAAGAEHDGNVAMLDLARVRFEHAGVDGEPEDVEAARRVEVELVVGPERHQRIDVDRLTAEQRRTAHRDRHADRARSAPWRAALVHRLVGRFAKQLHAGEAQLVQLADERSRRHLFVDLVPAVQARGLLLDVGACHPRHRIRRHVATAPRVGNGAPLRCCRSNHHQAAIPASMPISSIGSRQRRCSPTVDPGLSRRRAHRVPNALAIP